MEKYLFVVAHSDDEVLGAGALIREVTSKGDEVAVLVLNSEDDTRYHDDNGRSVESDLLKTHRFLGIRKTYVEKNPDSNFHLMDHRSMVETIERVIRAEKPDYIFTQHPGDINSDHYWTATSCMEAFRLWQRGREDGLKPIKGLYLMEVPSSTDWALNPSLKRFEPNTYFPVGYKSIEDKVDSLRMYENVIRPMPHPRSPEAIFALATSRGAQCGADYAEAFECVFRRGL